MSDHHQHDPDVPSGRILCQRGDGIGGRLLTLLWTLRFAAKVNAGVLMFWPSLDLFSYEGAAAGDIFDLYRLASPPVRNRLQIVDGDCRKYLRRKSLILNRKERYDPAAFVVPFDMDPARQKLPVILGHWEGPLLAFGESRKAALAEVPSLFAQLPIRADLMGEVDRVAAEHRLSDMVAVHVRRGEIVQNLREAVSRFRPNDPSSHVVLDERIGTFVRRCMSVDNFADSIREVVEQGRQILVFSDEASAPRDLANALGTSKVLSVASLVRDGFSPLQQAFVEAVLMSRCRSIVGARSAYSGLAHVIGGNDRVLLDRRSRSAEDCAAYLLQSISGELLSHPHREHLERRICDRIDGTPG